MVLGPGVGYGAVASLAPLAARPGPPRVSDRSEYTAALHVHSASSHDGRGSVARALMGATVPFKPGQTAVAEVPPVGDSVVRLLRDGAVLHEVPGETLLRVALPGPGVDRVEVDLRLDLFPIDGVAYRPWILSNPVYVRE